MPLFGLKWEDNAKKPLNSFATSFAKKNGMEFLNSGLGSLVDSHTVIWCLNMVDHRSMTIDQARPLVVGMVDEFLKLIYTNPVFTVYMKEYGKGRRSQSSELSPEIIGIKIAFWDQNVDRPLSPYLAQIRVLEGTIHYYYADPKTQAIQTPPIIETFDEARKKVKG